MKRIRERVHELTDVRRKAKDVKEIIASLNPVLTTCMSESCDGCGGEVGSVRVTAGTSWTRVGDRGSTPPCCRGHEPHCASPRLACRAP